MYQSFLVFQPVQQQQKILLEQQCCFPRSSKILEWPSRTGRLAIKANWLAKGPNKLIRMSPRSVFLHDMVTSWYVLCNIWNSGFFLKFYFSESLLRTQGWHIMTSNLVPRSHSLLHFTPFSLVAWEIGAHMCFLRFSLQLHYNSPDSIQSVLTYSCAVHLLPISVSAMSRNFIVSKGSWSLEMISRLHSSKWVW